MWLKHSLVAGSLLALAGATGGSLAQQEGGAGQGQNPQQERVQSEIREAERLEYERRMREAGSEQERERIRLEHQRKMQEREKQEGKTPPAGSSGKKKGQGGGGGPKR